MIRPHPAAVSGRRAVQVAGLVVGLVLVLLVTMVRPAGAAPPVDDWGRDPDVLSGTIDEVCGPAPAHDAAAARPGRVAMMEWLAETFPDVSGLSGFTCREIHNPRTSCRGRRAPATSDCWSSHAAGRAIDVFVGGAGDQEGTPVGKALGDRITNLLLATVDGIPNYRARVMGVQQLLWDGRCWSVREHADQAVTDINDLDGDCVDLHDDHVHITLSEAGAEGLTSFHTGTAFVGGSDGAAGEDTIVDLPSGDPRDAHLLAWDATEGRLLLRGLDVDGTFTDEEATEELAGTWTAVATPDVGGNGNDELFAYDATEGSHLLREIRADGSLGSRLEGDQVLEPGWSLVATPDVDGDGDDELLLYRGDDGTWALHELREDGDLGPALQVADVPLDVFFSNAATPDVDGDGDDELVLYRRFDGHHVLLDFADADLLAAGEAAEDDGDPGVEDADDEDGSDDPTMVDLDTDADDDGLADVTVALAPMAPVLVDAAGLPVEADGVADAGDDADGDDDSEAEADADPTGEAPAEAPALGASLTAGFTTMSAVDVDADGIDELALYREMDGCLALRTLRRPVVVVDDAADEEADDAAGTLVAEPVQPCLAPATPDAEAADDTDAAEGSEEDADESAIQALDPETWLLESHDALEPGWTSLVGVAVD